MQRAGFQASFGGFRRASRLGADACVVTLFAIRRFGNSLARVTRSPARGRGIPPAEVADVRTGLDPARNVTRAEWRPGMTLDG